MRHYFIAVFLFAGIVSTAFSAIPINLHHLSSAMLTVSPTAEKIALLQTRSEIDFNQTQHIRFQQQYEGYLVWGTQSVVHIAKGGQYKLRDLAQLRRDH